jgi:uncharacterized protein YegP (UPF0339 family)
MNIEIFTGDDGQHYARLRFANGNIFATTEGYSTRDDCEDSVHTLCHEVFRDNFYIQYRTNDTFTALQHIDEWLDGRQRP